MCLDYLTEFLEVLGCIWTLDIVSKFLGCVWTLEFLEVSDVYLHL